MKKRVRGTRRDVRASTPVSLRPAAAPRDPSTHRLTSDPHKGVRSPATGLPSPTRHRTRVFGSTCQ